MRLHHLALVAALGLSVPTTLAAQTTSGTSGTDTTSGSTSTQGTTSSGTSGSGSGSVSGTATGSQTTTGTTATQTSSGTQTTTTTTQTTTTSSYSDHPSRWIGSAFIGSSYNNNSASMPGGVSATAVSGAPSGGITTDTSTSSSLDFGFGVGYLWHGMAGAEFLAGFTPNFNMANSFVATGVTPNVNTYMVNAVGAYPIGADGRFQPYISGGFGGITLRGATAATGLTGGSAVTSTGNAVNDVFNPDESRGGGDIGFGLNAFAGNWGVRGDLRYFHAFSNNSSSTSTSTTTTGSTGTTGTTTGTTGTSVTSGSSGTVISGLLPGLNFWRANIGLAFRF